MLSNQAGLTRGGGGAGLKNPEFHGTSSTLSQWIQRIRSISSVFGVRVIVTFDTSPQSRQVSRMLRFTSSPKKEEGGFRRPPRKG